MSVYLKPRLAGLGATLNQQGGGIGTRGPGETKLETDSRLIDNRINRLRKELKKIEKQRILQSNSREKNNTPLVSIVGYTNAGMLNSKNPKDFLNSFKKITTKLITVTIKSN